MYGARRNHHRPVAFGTRTGGFARGVWRCVIGGQISRGESSASGCVIMVVLLCVGPAVCTATLVDRGANGQSFVCFVFCFCFRGGP